MWWDRISNAPVINHTRGADPYLAGEFRLSNGKPVKPAFQLLIERVRDCTPEWAAEITGIPAATIRRLAHELGITARDETIEFRFSNSSKADSRMSSATKKRTGCDDTSSSRKR